MNNRGFSNGLLAGLLSIIVLLVLYFIDMNIYMKWGGYILYVVYIYFMYKAGKESRDDQDGFISFGKVLGPIFLTFVVSSFVVFLFNYIMYNFIDQSLLDMMQEQAVAQIEKMSGMLGEEATELAMEEIEEKGVDFGWDKVLLGWGFNLIIPGIILALILAAILKKEDKSVV